MIVKVMMTFENIVKKRRNEQFLLLPQCFPLFSSPKHEVQGELLRSLTVRRRRRLLTISYK